MPIFFLDDDNIERPHWSKYDMTMGEVTISMTLESTHV